MGGANTLATAALFYGLSFPLPYPAAYAVAWLTGLAFVVIVTPRLVFSANATLGVRLRVAAAYLLGFAAGVLVSAALGSLAWPRPMVVVATVATAAAVSFPLSRMAVLRPHHRKEGSA